MGDGQSPLWSTRSSTGHVDIPASIRREAVNKYNLRERAYEEVQLLQLEMECTLRSIHNRIIKLNNSLPESVNLSEQTLYRRGKTALINARIHELCTRVYNLRKVFAPYHTDQVLLPSHVSAADYESEALDSAEDEDENLAIERQKEIEYWDSVADEYIEYTRQHQTDRSKDTATFEDFSSCTSDESDSDTM